MVEGLRQVQYADADGKMSMRLIPTSATDDEAERGVVVGPPSLAGLDLPPHIEVALNNELFARGLLTETDIKRRRVDAIAAVMAACRVDVDRLLAVIAADNAAAI